MTAAVEVVTEVSRLRERVTEFWPRWAARFNVAQAAGVLRRFRRFAVDELLAALELHYEANPDGRAPVWTEVWDEAERVAGRARALRGPDEAGAYRRWWGSWRRTPQARAEPERIAWALEIIACDDRTRVGTERTVMAADYEAWHAAVFAYGAWAFYRAGRPWWPEDGGPLVLELAAGPVVVRPGERGAPPPNAPRLRELQECHRRVRNLRTFGSATRNWKDAALRALEAEARAAGVRLEGLEDLAAASPF